MAVVGWDVVVCLAVLTIGVVVAVVVGSVVGGLDRLVVATWLQRDKGVFGMEALEVLDNGCGWLVVCGHSGVVKFVAPSLGHGAVEDVSEVFVGYDRCICWSAREEGKKAAVKAKVTVEFGGRKVGGLADVANVFKVRVVRVFKEALGDEVAERLIKDVVLKDSGVLVGRV